MNQLLESKAPGHTAHTLLWLAAGDYRKTAAGYGPSRAAEPSSRTTGQSDQPLAVLIVPGMLPAGYQMPSRLMGMPLGTATQVAGSPWLWPPRRIYGVLIFYSPRECQCPAMPRPCPALVYCNGPCKSGLQRAMPVPSHSPQAQPTTQLD